MLATDNLGWRLENVVLIELLRRTKPMFADIFYYKGRDSQVDFVVAKNGKVLELVQVSYSIANPKTERREIKGLTDASKALGCDKMTLVTLDTERDITTDRGNIQVVSATNWLTDRFEM